MLTIKINVVENVLDDFKHFYRDEEFIDYNNKLTTAEIASNNQQHRPADACINWHKKKKKKRNQANIRSLRTTKTPRNLRTPSS